MSFLEVGIVVEVMVDLAIKEVELGLGGGGEVLGTRRRVGGNISYILSVPFKLESATTPAVLKALPQTSTQKAQATSIS